MKFVLLAFVGLLSLSTILAACGGGGVETHVRVSSPMPTRGAESKDAEFYFGRGDFYTAQGQYELAIQAYDEVIRLYPESVGAYVNRGNAYKELDKH